MKRLFLISLVSILSSGVFAQDSGLGLGLIFGEPTGLSAKLWTSERTALDAAVAWSFSGVGYFHIQSDFLIHNYDLLSVSQGKLPVYYGLGAFLAFSSNLGLALLPDLGFYFGGGIGVRYFF